GNAEKISHVSLRYFNVVGSAIPEFGDNSKDNLVPKVFLALKSGKHPEIYGSDYPTPDGTCIRDYIHVQDLAKAHVAALKKAESGFTSAVYNVGSGKESVRGGGFGRTPDTLGRDHTLHRGTVAMAEGGGDEPGGGLGQHAADPVGWIGNLWNQDPLGL
ncbi:MAG: NAD-dependent epimerase/dehydratase family protein, partial [Actinobacteria bacterium]|nr:NAD-dependent epimerase/dehydratase family protein [Actinomycetota bacterium]